MAHGLNTVLKRAPAVCGRAEGKTGVGSRRIFPPQFKLQVLDSYRSDADCKGNQRATARKYGIHRRQIQKWLQVEENLRSSLGAKAAPRTTPAPRLNLNLNVNVNPDAGYAPRGGEFPARMLESPPEVVESARVYVPSAESSPTLSADRQRDDCRYVRDAYAQIELSPGAYSETQPGAALDFTTRARCCAAADGFDELAPRAAPMDLSLRKPPQVLNPPPFSAVPLYPTRPSPAPRSPNPDVWDLSTKRHKRPLDDVTGHASASPKPVKLFKPYLDDVREEERLAPEPYQPHYVGHATADVPYYHHHHNNNVIDVKLEPFYVHSCHSGCSYSVASGYPPGHDGGGGTYGEAAFAPQTYYLDLKFGPLDDVCHGDHRAAGPKSYLCRSQAHKWSKYKEEVQLKRNDNFKIYVS